MSSARAVSGAGVLPVAVLAVAVLSGAVLAVFPAEAQTVNDPGLQVETVATGLTQPTSMAFIGDDDILVLQKANGQVRRIVGGVLQPGFVLDVAVHFLSERGLLGIAVDPDFVLNRQVYLYYTESSTGADTSSSTSIPLGNRVYRYTWNGTALVNPVLILNLPVTSGPNHNGGVIAFGPDGALYVVIGDLNRNGKLQNIPTGPDPDDSGVIFRVDTNGAGLAGNPFYNALNPSDPMNRYFAYGVRNSFGLTFDPLTGDLWDTENGPNVFDEVNRVTPGFNSGWNQIMGRDVDDPQGQADLWVAPGSAYSDPEFSWNVPVAPTAPVFPSSPILGCGQLHTLLVGDNNCGQLYRFRPNAARDALTFSSPALQDTVANNAGAVCSDEMAEILFGSGFPVITDLENGPDGKLYVVALNSGAIYRLGPKAGAFPDADGDRADDRCDCAPSDAGAFARPFEVPRLRAAGGAPADLIWDTQAATAGPATAYTVVTGDARALRPDGGFASACTLARGLAATSLTDARPDPPAGSATYYLVRAENACADGTFGDGSGSPDPRDLLDATLPAACPGGVQTGGAYITFRIVNESLTAWITNGPFIDRAKELLSTGARQIPVFGTLLDGQTSDPQWTWHVDPQNVSFADAAIELCDGLPSHIEANKAYWLGTVGSYCPWSAAVSAVDDRR
jgi:glucose/arabinose dehydrogenase